MMMMILLVFNDDVVVIYLLFIYICAIYIYYIYIYLFYYAAAHSRLRRKGSCACCVTRARIFANACAVATYLRVAPRSPRRDTATRCAAVAGTFALPLPHHCSFLATARIFGYTPCRMRLVATVVTHRYRFCLALLHTPPAFTVAFSSLFHCGTATAQPRATAPRFCVFVHPLAFSSPLLLVLTTLFPLLHGSTHWSYRLV